ncbi:hypothetical protein DFS34DRAFT_683401 [Phlyctochytrium arcticum]|nr:hypothetical protein DFS34DRAFT_683401 [Phlyctochytrium arcticum]
MSQLNNQNMPPFNSSNQCSSQQQSLALALFPHPSPNSNHNPHIFEANPRNFQPNPHNPNNFHPATYPNPNMGQFISPHAFTPNYAGYQVYQGYMPPAQHASRKQSATPAPASGYAKTSRWPDEENACLAKCWIGTSENAIKGTGQKDKSLYNTKMARDHPNAFPICNAYICAKFGAIVKKVKAKPSSGSGNNDVMGLVRIEWCQKTNKSSFGYEGSWAVLKDFPRFFGVIEQEVASAKPEQERPIGNKAAKEKERATKRKRGAADDEGAPGWFDMSMDILRMRETNKRKELLSIQMFQAVQIFGKDDEITCTAIKEWKDFSREEQMRNMCAKLKEEKEGKAAEEGPIDVDNEAQVEEDKEAQVEEDKQGL